MAVWGWYSIMLAPATDAPGGSTVGLVARAPQARAFWAAWWTEDPRRTPDTDPDDYGFVEGARPLDAAIGAAYDALRRGRGPRVYDVSVGEQHARRAFREGAPQRRSPATDFDAISRGALAELGLDETATVADVKRAWRRRALVLHPDRGGDAATFIELEQRVKVALAIVERRAAEIGMAAAAAGKGPARKRRKPRKKPAREDLPL